MKIVFLDRDGTINKDYPDEHWRNKVNPEILPGALEGMRGLKDLGYKIIIITNQHIINDNIISIDDYRLFTDNLLLILRQHEIKVLDLFYCSHSIEENCNCRKPNTGMIQSAMSKYPEIELEHSIVIGDSKCDQDLSESLGINFYGINGHHFKNKYESINEIYKILEKRLNS